MQRPVIALLLVSTCLLSHFTETVNSAQFNVDFLKEVLRVYLERYSKLPPHAAELKGWYKLRIVTLLKEICQEDRDCLREVSQQHPGIEKIMQDPQMANIY